MLRRSLLISAVALIAGSFAPMIPAMAGSDPIAFISELDNQFRSVSGNPSTPQRIAEFRQLFRQDFDGPGLGRFVLGRFAQFLTPLEQQEFLTLFETYVVYTYSDRLSDFAADGSVLRVTASRPDADGAIVSTEVTRGNSALPIGIDWRLTWQNGVYRISDVVIDGLSMAVNGRTELEGVVERNGGQPQAILAVMRQECASAAPQQ
jgi:phospholipid transport system substrate-binding protein